MNFVLLCKYVSPHVCAGSKERNELIIRVVVERRFWTRQRKMVVEKEKERVWVTGAGGYLASWVVKFLL